MKIKPWFTHVVALTMCTTGLTCGCGSHTRNVAQHSRGSEQQEEFEYRSNSAWLFHLFDGYFELEKAEVDDVVYMNPEYKHKVIDALDLEPGMVVADVGAGMGVFTFHLAEAVGPSGEVIATDVSPVMVAGLKLQASARGVKNVRVVQVRADGVDPVYSRQPLDRVFLFEVFEWLTDPAAYFRDMRRNLRPKVGRVFIVQPDMVQPLTDSTSWVPQDLWGVIKGLPDEDPLMKRLLHEPGNAPHSASARSGQAQARPGLSPLDYIEKLNALASDPELFPEMARFYVDQGKDLIARVKPRNRLLFLWLSGRWPRLARLGREGLARLLVYGTFCQSPLRHNIALKRSLERSDRGIIERMRSAGYRLAKRMDEIPGYFVLGFAPAE